MITKIQDRLKQLNKPIKHNKKDCEEYFNELPESDCFGCDIQSVMNSSWKQGILFFRDMMIKEIDARIAELKKNTKGCGMDDLIPAFNLAEWMGKRQELESLKKKLEVLK